MSKLTQFLETNFQNHSQQKTTSDLGDRSQYIGASDIGSCLRKAYLSKTESVTHSFEQLIVFARGHVGETLIKQMLDSGSEKLTLREQVEVTGEVEGFKTKAHIDFVLESKDEIINFEVKTTSTPLEHPYDSWIIQVHHQMALLQKTTTKKIRSYVIAIDLNTGWLKPFEIDYNPYFASVAEKRTSILAKALLNKEEPQAEEQLYCSRCEFKANCPAHTMAISKEVPQELQQQFSKLLAFRPHEKQVKNLKKQIAAYMDAIGVQQLTLGNHKITKVDVAGKEVVDYSQLKAMYPEASNNVKVKRDGYSFLKII
jgi:CRISPR-associated exonuclease Cas4